MGGALTNLTAIHLVYAGTQNPINQAVAGFCMLQLRSLTVSNGSNSGGKPGPVRNSQQHPQLKMGSSSFRQLGSIRGLTSLTLIGVQIGVLPAAQLADTFKQMTALRALQLSDVLLESGRGSVTSAMGGPAYTRIAALPYLESLSLTGMHLQYSDAAALAAAAHLTHLKVRASACVHRSRLLGCMVDVVLPLWPDVVLMWSHHGHPLWFLSAGDSSTLCCNGSAAQRWTNCVVDNSSSSGHDAVGFSMLYLVAVRRCAMARTCMTAS